MASAAAAAYESDTGPGTWTVHVPGGTLTVILQQHTAFLRGPAILIADSDIRGDWWRRAGPAGQLAGGANDN